MNTTEHEIENVLRAAPNPAPPAGLKERLIAQVRLAPPQTLPSPLAPAGWLRRWWPALIPAAASLACAVGLTVQQMEIQGLKQVIQDLSRDSAPKARALPPPTVQTNDVESNADAVARTQQEIARLKALASQLAAEVAQLEQMRADNAKLRTQLAAPPADYLTPEETEALAKAKERAESIQCINNLKQMGLAFRVWALDNNNMSPPDMLSMSNELSTPKILVCPTDKTHEAANGWASYSSSHCSYEYLAPSVPVEYLAPSAPALNRSVTELRRVIFRCPIHGHVCLSDGSVWAEVAKKHPDWLVQRDGKLYWEPAAQPPSVAPSQSSKADQAFRRRYGLPGAPAPTPPPATEPPAPPDSSNP
ncbi:MAG: hypothetical protein ACLQU3_10970 [Limisphaerales bacterium]